MQKVIYKDIALMIGKSEQQIKWYKANNKNMLELLKIGAFCKKNGLSLEMIEDLIKLKQKLKEG